MSTRDLLSVSEAAGELSVNESRVRAMLKADQLEGVKQAGRWLVYGRSVRRRRRAGSSRGRRLRPSNAWGALALASGEEAAWLSREERYRLRRVLDANSLPALRGRLEDRAKVHRLRGHPGVLRHLAEHPRLALTGASAAAAHRLELVAGEEIDAYVPHGEVGTLARKFALSPSDDHANVVLREMPRELWPFRDRVAPLAAVALDLLEDADARSVRTARRALAELSASGRWRTQASTPSA
jgi:hypothetical protein